MRLLPCPSPLLPAGYPHQPVPAAWWVTEVAVPADNHLDEPHVHVDHQYIALANSAAPMSEPAHPFAWFGRGDLTQVSMFEDTRLLAALLFDRIGDLARIADRGPVDLLAAVGFS